MRLQPSLLACALTMVGCGSDGTGDPWASAGAGTDTASSSGSSGASTTATSTSSTGPDATDSGGQSSSGQSSSGQSSGGPKFDTPDGMTGGSDGTTGCNKVDFLFVVDNSGSMEFAQTKLGQAFPDFIQAIRDKVEGSQYHIMVTDSDNAGTWCCEPELWGGEPASGSCGNTCAEASQHSYCSGYTCGMGDMLDAADNTLGCGVVRPYGGRASNKDCGVTGGGRFMTEDQPDMEETFECLTKVGTSGHWWERPASAAVAALSPELTGSGGCNEGFLRDDAILVIAILSDDPPMTGDLDDALGSNGSAQQWYDAIVAAKGGNASAVVMMGAFRYQNGLPIGPPTDFIELVELFGDQGKLVPIENGGDGLIDWFVESVDLIDTTCDDFVPEG